MRIGSATARTSPAASLMIGCGSVGQTVLPLLLRDFALDPRPRSRCSRPMGAAGEIAAALGVRFEIAPLTRDNLASVLGARLRPGDFLLNLSVEVVEPGAVALRRLARRALSRYRHRALARRLHRPRSVAGGAIEPGVPHARAGPARGAGPGQPDRRDLPGRQSRAWCHSCSRPPRSSSRVQWGSRRSRRTAPMAGPAVPRPRRSAPSRSPSTTARSAARRRRPASSSPPGRSTASWARGRSRRSWAGARPRSRYRRTAAEHRATAPGIYLTRPGVDVRVRSWAPEAGPFIGYLITHMEVALDRRPPDAAVGRRHRLSAHRALRLSPLPRRCPVGA